MAFDETRAVKYLFGIGGIVFVICLATTAYYQYPITPTALGLAIQNKQVVADSRDEPAVTSTREVPRWFKRDSDAEEVLGLVDYGNAYAFKYEGGILWATIYQADGQVLFSNVGRRIDPSFKLSDHCGRLLVIVTDDREIKVFDPISHVEKLLDEVAVKGSTTIKSLYPPLKLAPPQSDAANSLGGGSLFVTKDYACIFRGESLFMELRWAEEDLELDTETKNQIWWDIERSRNENRAAYMQIKRSRDKKRPAYVHMFSRMVEVQRIAKGYGIAYEQAKAIHDQGKTAEWRTETPPGGETETPATVRPTP